MKIMHIAPLFLVACTHREPPARRTTAPPGHFLDASQLFLGSAAVELADGKVELRLLTSDDEHVQLVAVSGTGAPVLWETDIYEGGTVGLFRADDCAIAVRAGTLYDQDALALQARRFCWSDDRAALVADGEFDGDLGDPGPAWIPPVAKDVVNRIAPQEEGTDL